MALVDIVTVFQSADESCDAPAKTAGLCRKHYHRRWYLQNRERKLAANRQWNEAHAAERAAYIAEYGKAHKEEGKAKSQRYRERHPDRVKDAQKRAAAARVAYQRAYRAANVDRVRSYMREYQQRHPESYRRQSSLRRARQLGAEGSYTAEEWAETLAAFKGLCAYCGAPATTRDHVVPLARGGSNWIDNLVPACRPCNSSKGDRLLEEWQLWPSST